MCIRDSVKSGLVIGSVLAHTDAVTDIDFSHNGKIFVTTSQDGTVMIWDVAQRRRINSIKGPVVLTLTLSPDSRRLITGDENGHIAVWEFL